MTPDPDYFAATDLLRVLDVGLPRGAHLHSRAEVRLLEALAHLPLPVLDSWARVVKRRHLVQRISDVDASDALLEAGLIEPIAGLPCIQRLTVAELRAYLQTQGQRPPRRARRPQLLEVACQLPVGPLPIAFVQVRHHTLWLRLWRSFTLRAFPNPDLPVLQRLGIRSWPTYATTGGALLWSDREHLLAWEALADRLLEPPEPEVLIRAHADPAAVAPGRLDLRRPIRRRLWEVGSTLEAEAPEAAASCYDALLSAEDRYTHRARLRMAMLHERAGTPARGLQLLERCRPGTTGWRRLAVNRTGKRLARVCRTSWAPDRPLPAARSRRLPLAASASDGPRPRFEGAHVEEAVIQRLGQLGRTALHSEGGLWKHLFALLFAPHCYFDAVPGALPAPFLPGPLDLGTPAFAKRRQPSIARTWKQIRAGDAADLARTTHEMWSGTHLAGARWDRTVDEDLALLDAIGVPVLECVLGTLLERGLRASRGMPDLIVLPGEQIEWPRAHPRRIGPQLHFAELKTPNDTLSDPQRWWLARLHRVARVEVWQVEPDRHTRQR